MAAGKLLGLAAVAANSAAVDLAAVGESEEEEETCNWSREGSGDATGLYEEGSEEDDEEDDGVGGKRKRMSVDDRKARNRERNRLHARKTRQRKKQHVQELQLKIWGLRQERQRLLQLSTEHRTAGVLLALSCSPKQCVQRAGTGSSSSSSGNSTSPRLPPTLKLTKTAATPAVAIGSTRDWSREVASHEEALRKITQEFERMDGSQQVGGEEDELAAAGAAGTNVGRSRAQSSASSTSSIGGSGAGGGKGGSRGVKGTLADRTALRRERNRMHAKRTRNRKKLFVEACSVMIDKMVSHTAFQVPFLRSFFLKKSCNSRIKMFGVSHCVTRVLGEFLVPTPYGRNSCQVPVLDRTRRPMAAAAAAYHSWSFFLSQREAHRARQEWFGLGQGGFTSCDLTFICPFSLFFCGEERGSKDVLSEKP